NVGRISLAADHQPGPAPVVYAVASRPVYDGARGPMLLGVFRTEDNGANWALRSPRGNLRDYLAEQGFYNLAIGVMSRPDTPGAPPLVYLGGAPPDTMGGVLRSTDAGVNWAAIDDPNSNKLNPHSDHHAFAFDGGTVFDGNDGGIWKFTSNA